MNRLRCITTGRSGWSTLNSTRLRASGPIRFAWCAANSARAALFGFGRTSWPPWLVRRSRLGRIPSSSPTMHRPSSAASLLWVGRCPRRVLDLFCEFRNATNGRGTVAGNGLLGAMTQCGLAGIEAAEKSNMRDLAIRGGPYTDDEREALLEYCESDVLALAKLLPRMVSGIDVPRALIRGRYMAAVAQMDAHRHTDRCRETDRAAGSWCCRQAALIQRVDVDYGVYEAAPSSVIDSHNGWLIMTSPGHDWSPANSPWTTTPSDRLARAHPEVVPLRELRHSLGEMRLESLTIGSDGRNRCLLSPFRSITGRNQPSNSKFIFGPSCWLRSLIRPEPGQVLAYVDWSQQEFGIAAASPVTWPCRKPI